MKRMSLWITVFVGSMVIGIASAIQCYSCNSNFDDDCGYDSQPLNEKHLIQCDANATLCRKIDIYVSFKSATNGLGPNRRCVRQCGHDQSDESSSYYSTGYGGEETAWMCRGDGCNPASSLSGSYCMTLLPIFLCLAFFKLKLFSE